MAIPAKIFLNAPNLILPFRHYLISVVFLIVFSMLSGNLEAQASLFSGILVSDSGIGNNIGNANSSRNVATSSTGIIYVTYSGSLGIKVSKSTNRGQSFLPSVSITSFSSEPEIIVNDLGYVFVSWIESGNIMLSRSIDEGNTFSSPILVGAGNFSLHMNVFEDYLYIVDKTGEFVYINSNNGLGTFNFRQFNRRVFSDVWVTQNGTVYIPSDNPMLFLFKSLDSGQNFSSIGMNPSRNIFFSSYALSDGPCGTYIFVGGGGLNSTVGYKIDVNDGSNTPINLGQNFNFQGRALYADNRGTLIDSYQSITGAVEIRVSNDQGQTFDAPLIVSQGDSHNITVNQFYNDVVIVYQQSTGIYVSVYDTLLKSITLVETTTPIVICSDKTFELPFTLTGSFSTNTFFEAYLSDASGSFENKTLIGSVTTNTDGSITCTIPSGITSGNGYRVHIQSLADCTQSDSFALEIITPSTASISSALPICEGNDAIFTITGTPNSEVYYSGISSTSTNPVVLDASGEATITVLSPTTDQIITLDSVSDLGGVCVTPLTETATVVVNPLPNSRLEAQYVLCVDVNGTEIINPPIIDTFLSTDDYSFEWYFNGDLQTQFNNLSVIAPSISGTYNVVITDNSTGCIAANNSAVVNESSPPIISAKIMSSAFSNPHTIEVEATNSASNNAISEYEFSINNGDWELGFGTPGGTYDFTFEDNILMGANIIKVRDAVGCGEAEVEVVVMDYPKFFTPNNDTNNDTWNIVAPKTPINYLATAQVYIYNRYGKLLKQISPNGMGWDGVFNGRLMPNDDYWFVVNFIDPLDNQPKQFKAHFALKR